MMMPTELACDDVPVRIDWQFADVKLWQTQMLLQEVERVMKATADFLGKHLL